MDGCICKNHLIKWKRSPSLVCIGQSVAYTKQQTRHFTGQMCPHKEMGNTAIATKTHFMGKMCPGKWATAPRIRHAMYLVNSVPKNTTVFRLTFAPHSIDILASLFCWSVRNFVYIYITHTMKTIFMFSSEFGSRMITLSWRRTKHYLSKHHLYNCIPVQWHCL